VQCAYGDEAVVEEQVEEAGDHPLVPGEAGLDGVLDDGLHAGVAALAGVVAVGELGAAAHGGGQHHDEGGEQRGWAGRLHLRSAVGGYTILQLAEVVYSILTVLEKE
jgi:hypothetical protein